MCWGGNETRNFSALQSAMGREVERSSLGPQREWTHMGREMGFSLGWTRVCARTINEREHTSFSDTSNCPHSMLCNSILPSLLFHLFSNFCSSSSFLQTDIINSEYGWNLFIKRENWFHLVRLVLSTQFWCYIPVGVFFFNVVLNPLVYLPHSWTKLLV